jgi:hypothetical protein
MFPGSGVPSSDAANSLPNPNTKNCDELWYSTSRCQPRFDPAAANAVLSELINYINRGEVSYDCTKLDQLETAARYLIQRGIPCGASALVGPTNYVVTLDPAATRYNDFMSLVLVPETTNTGPVKINVNGLGLVDVFRNDGLPLQAGDWVLNRPLVVSCWHGVFYHTGLVRSQVMPSVLKGFRADAAGFAPQSIATSIGVPLANYHMVENTMSTGVFDGITLTIGAGEAGLWDIHGQWVFPLIAAGANNIGCGVDVNGALAALQSTSTPANTACSCSVASTLRLVAGDRVKIQAYHQAGIAVNSEASNRQYFTAYLISR